MEQKIDEQQLIIALKAAAKDAVLELAVGFNPTKRTDDRTYSKEASVVTEKIAEKKFREQVLKNYPDIKIVGEEEGIINGNSEYAVIIDPLDGTGNFANGNPFFALCAGLMKKDELIWGIVVAPELKMEWEAKAGNGAFCNGQAITVSRINDLGRSYVVWCEGGCNIKKRTQDIYDAIYPRVTDMRKLGAVSIEGCFVAMGKAEAYVSTALKIWDVAPAVLIVREAGGRVTDHCGDDWTPGQEDLVFSNGLLHENLLSLVKGK